MESVKLSDVPVSLWDPDVAVAVLVNVSRPLLDVWLAVTEGDMESVKRRRLASSDEMVVVGDGETVLVGVIVSEPVGVKVSVGEANAVLVGVGGGVTVMVGLGEGSRERDGVGGAERVCVAV
jgi:hypothetical protein